MPKQKTTSTATMNAVFPARFLPMIFIEDAAATPYFNLAAVLLVSSSSVVNGSISTCLSAKV